VLGNPGKNVHGISQRGKRGGATVVYVLGAASNVARDDNLLPAIIICSSSGVPPQSETTIERSAQHYLSSKERTHWKCWTRQIRKVGAPYDVTKHRS